MDSRFQVFRELVRGGRDARRGIFILLMFPLLFCALDTGAATFERGRRTVVLNRNVTLYQGQTSLFALFPGSRMDGAAVRQRPDGVSFEGATNDSVATLDSRLTKDMLAMRMGQLNLLPHATPEAWPVIILEDRQ